MDIRAEVWSPLQNTAVWLGAWLHGLEATDNLVDALADLGAEVIKIERPGTGDWTRSWGPYVNGLSTAFASLNRNKRSIAVNLKDAAGQAIVHDLVAQADVFIQNYRAGVAHRLGVDYATLRAINPALVYVSISGYGEDGPYALRT